MNHVIIQISACYIEFSFAKNKESQKLVYTQIFDDNKKKASEQRTTWSLENVP